MSDTFDHAFDAYSSRFDEDYEEDDDWFGGGSLPDPNFYHSSIRFYGIIDETEKSIKINISDKKPFEVWVAKKICRNWNYDTKTVLIHTDTFRKILKTKLEDRKIGA